MATATKKPDERLPSFAVHYLDDALFEVLLNRGHAAKVSELAAELTGLPVGAKMVKKELVNSDRFAQEDRRWNLAIRRMSDRPLAGALEYHLRAYGKPMSVGMLANEMALVDKSPMPPAQYQAFLPSFLASRPKFFSLDDRWGLAEWLLDLRESEDGETTFLRNFFGASAQTQDQAEKLAAAKLPASTELADAALRLLSAAGQPLNAKLLAYALWRHRPDLDPLALFTTLAHDERLLMLSGPLWAPRDLLPALLSTLEALSAQAEEEEEVMPEGAEEMPVTVSPSDVDELVSLITEHGRPTQVIELAGTVFELVPAKVLELALRPVNSALEADSRVERVGVQTWALPSYLPEHIQDIPADLLISAVLREHLEEDTDAEMDDDGLESNLAMWVHDPRYENFGEEQEIELAGEMPAEGLVVEEIRYPLLYDHWRVGTLKIRESDTHFFPMESQLIYGLFKEDGGEFPAWVNQFNALVYDLREWYQRAGLAPGSIFSLRHGELPDRYVLSYTGEVDPLIAIEPARLAQLEALREPAQAEQWSVFEIMQKVMADQGKGIHFLTLWAEVNVVRRTSRRGVASNLSAYHAFYTRPAGSDTWVYDERKVPQGRKKAKRKFVRR